MAEAQGITCLQPLSSSFPSKAAPPLPWQGHRHRAHRAHRPRAATTPPKETGGAHTVEVVFCCRMLSAPTCAFLPPCSQIHSESRGFSSGSGPAERRGNRTVSVAVCVRG